MDHVATATSIRRRIRAVAWFALGFLLLTHGGHFYAVDGYTVLLTANALLEGRLDIPQGIGTVVGSDGQHYGMYSIGLPLLFTAFASIGSWLDAAAPSLFGRIVGPSVSLFYPENFSVFFSSLVCPIFGALTAAATWGLAEILGYRRSVAAVVTATVLFATQIWPASRDSFPQIVVTACLLSVTLHLITWNDARFRQMPIVAGMILGLCLLVRPFDVIVVAPVLFVFSAVQGWRQIFSAATPLEMNIVRFWLPVVVCGLLLALLNAMRFGNPLTFVPAGQTTIAFNHPLGAGILGLLTHPQRGLVPYSPAVILGACGLVALLFRRPASALLFSGFVLSYLVAYGRYSLWNDGVSWGARFLVPLVPFLVLPLGELLSIRVPRLLLLGFLSLLIVTFVLGVAIQIGGVAVDFHRATPAVATTTVRWPVIEHWGHLLAGEYIDVVAWRVLDASGVLIASAYLLLPLLLLTYGVWSLKHSWHDVLPR